MSHRVKGTRKKKKPNKPRTALDVAPCAVTDLFAQSLKATGKVNLMGLNDKTKDKEEGEGDGEEGEVEVEEQAVKKEEEEAIKQGNCDRIITTGNKRTGVEVMIPPLAINMWHADKFQCIVPTHLQVLALPKLPIGKRVVGPTVQILPVDFTEFFRPMFIFIPHSSAIDFNIDNDDVEVLICNASRGASWKSVSVTSHLPCPDGNVWKSFLSDEDRDYEGGENGREDDEGGENTESAALGPCGDATAVERGVVVEVEYEG